MKSYKKPQSSEKNPIEIERKFLVNSLPEDLEMNPHEKIRQGYLVIGIDGSEARVRDRNGQYTITVKSKGELSRGEWEVAIDESQFESLWPGTDGKRIEKTRYSIPYNESLIELDIYDGQLEGLISAEVEFNDEADAKQFVPPDWMSTEITYEKGFKNQQLASFGLPE